MKRRMIAFLLAAIMVVSLLPTMAFAADDFTITNGTPESAKETNHGYIAIDETAAEGETVTVTVNPADGYQLKSLTVTPTSAVPAGFVDLGITDAEGKPLYWKETNLGASQAEESGYYYAWGGTTGYTYKDTKWVDAETSVELSGGFSSANAPYYKSVAYAKYTGSDYGILQPEDDAATAENLNWRIPTIAEFQALKDKCYWEWTDNYKNSGVKGVVVYRAGKNEDAGKYNGQEGYNTSNTHIFLPAAGNGVNKSLSNVNNNALYWSSTLNSSDERSASCLLCNKSSGNVYDKGFVRSNGFPIRPVTTSSNPEITPAEQTDGTYQFKMPDYAVTVTAEFEEADSTATFDFTTNLYGHEGVSSGSGTTYVDDGDIAVGEKFNEDPAQIEFTVNGSTQTRFWDASNKHELRLYKGATFVLSVVGDYKITKVEFTGSAVNLEANGTTVSDKVWEGNATKSITFVNTATGSKINSIKVTYIAVDPAAEIPTITPSTVNNVYWEPITVTLDCETEGATIHYTLDGSDPTTESAVYSEPLSISATTTVKAMAVKEGLGNSEVVSKTFTFGTIFDSLEELVEKQPAKEDVAYVEVTITDAVIDSFYVTSKGYTNGIYVTAADTTVELYTNDVPETWEAGGKVSGTIKAEWLLYKGVPELQKWEGGWDAFTYTAPATTYAITNGTAEVDKETNHGYISIDKTTAAEGETVTITVNPAEGYQLKANSLKVTYNDGEEKTIIPTPVQGKDNEYTFEMPGYAVTVTAEFEAIGGTGSGEWFGYCTEDSQIQSSIGVGGGKSLTFAIKIPVASLPNQDVLSKVSFYTYEIGTYHVRIYSTDPSAADPGTADPDYEQEFTVSNSNKWEDVVLTTPYVVDKTKNLWIGIETTDPAYPATFSTEILETTDCCMMYFQGTWYPITELGPFSIQPWMIRGYFETVAPAHTHSFTYTVNNGKLTATCVDGCDDGYDTNPLTLTLTAPASLVYDGNAKVFTFADGEAAAWTGAGLELPTITYYQKYSGQGWYTQLNEVPVNAGGDYMVEITVNKKAAQIYFTIDKATPYIKTNPAPTDIEYGKKLSDSTLFGGYVQVSSTNNTQVGGLFEWTNPDTVPGIDDSEITEYDVTFTPADTNNYNTVSCKITIKVTHIHNLIKVTGQAATEEAAGWRDYYECACGNLFEDVNGTTPIENLAAWKAEGGNGYIAPLVHGTDENKDHKCDYCEQIVSDHTDTDPKDHVCDYCGATISECVDEDKDHVCDYCGAEVSLCPLDKFTDAPKYDNWAHVGIDFCIVRGLMNGVSEDQFDPDGTMTRAMLVTVLWRLEGSPASAAKVPFTDLEEEWYEQAVTWAYENKVVNGTAYDKFSPNDTVTREQMAAILYRYSNWKGFKTEKRADLSAFPDADKVGAWATDAVQWAVAENLIGGSQKGSEIYLLPADSAARAQVAAILMRFIQNIAEK